MVFKKDLTPIGGKRGKVVKHAGKGSSRPPPRSFGDQVGGRYPKPAPVSEPEPASAMTPPFGIGVRPDDV